MNSFAVEHVGVCVKLWEHRPPRGKRGGQVAVILLSGDSAEEKEMNIMSLFVRNVGMNTDMKTLLWLSELLAKPLLNTVCRWSRISVSFWLDNNPKHTCKAPGSFLRRNRVSSVSPHLNPAEPERHYPSSIQDVDRAGAFVKSQGGHTKY